MPGRLQPRSDQRASEGDPSAATVAQLTDLHPCFDQEAIRSPRAGTGAQADRLTPRR